jgi:hypothetical protein
MKSLVFFVFLIIPFPLFVSLSGTKKKKVQPQDYLHNEEATSRIVHYVIQIELLLLYVRREQMAGSRH